MPNPVYILCAERISVDQETNLVSLFNVIDRIDVDLWAPDSTRPPHQQIAMLGAKVVSKWASVPDDEGRKFECETIIDAPGAKQSASSGILEFTFEKGMLFHRFITSMSQLPPIAESGEITIESRVRRKGRRTWQSQAVVIPVVIKMHGKLDFQKNKKTNGKH